MRQRELVGYFKRGDAPKGMPVVSTGFKRVVRVRRQVDDISHAELGAVLAHTGSALCLTSAARYHGFSLQEAVLTFLAVDHTKVYKPEGKREALRIVGLDFTELRALKPVKEYPFGQGGTMISMTTPAFTLAHMLSKSAFMGGGNVRDNRQPKYFIGKDEILECLPRYAMRYSLREALIAARALGVKEGALNLLEGALAMQSAA